MLRSGKIGLAGLFAILAALPGSRSNAAAAPSGPVARSLPSPVVGSALAGLEPSGLVWDGDKTLYMASDNGKIAMKTLDAADWTVLYTGEESKLNDFESVAVVPGKPGLLYVGVEGTSKASCKKKNNNVDCRPEIREFNVATKAFTANQWRLDDIKVGETSGMEAMTFVPDSSARTAEKGGFGGYFLASSQESTTIYAYDLDKEHASGKKVSSAFHFDLGGRILSDLYFSPTTSILYVAHDDDSGPQDWVAGKQSVEEFQKSLTDRKGYTPIAATPLPLSRGLEGVTFVHQASSAAEPVNDLYIAIDMSDKQAATEGAHNAAAVAKRVDKYSPYPAVPTP